MVRVIISVIINKYQLCFLKAIVFSCSTVTYLTDQIFCFMSTIRKLKAQFMVHSYSVSRILWFAFSKQSSGVACFFTYLFPCFSFSYFLQFISSFCILYIPISHITTQLFETRPKCKFKINKHKRHYQESKQIPQE